MPDFSDELKRKAKQNIVNTTNAEFDPNSKMAVLQKIISTYAPVKQIAPTEPATDIENKAAIRNADLNDPTSYASVRRKYIKEHPDVREFVVPSSQPPPEQRGYASEEEVSALANQLADMQMKQDRFKNLKKPRGK